MGIDGSIRRGAAGLGLTLLVFLLAGCPGDLYRLQVQASPALGGTVSLSPDDGVYRSGELVSVQAQPAAGWEFTHWSGNVANTTTAKTKIRVYQTEVVVAYFQVQGTPVSTEGESEGETAAGAEGESE